VLTLGREAKKNSSKYGSRPRKPKADITSALFICGMVLVGGVPMMPLKQNGQPFMTARNLLKPLVHPA